MAFRTQWAKDELEGLSKCRFQGHILGDSNAVGLVRGPGVCIFNGEDDSDAGGSQNWFGGRVNCKEQGCPEGAEGWVQEAEGL